MSEDQLQEMSFWDHIDALRSVLVPIVVVLLVAAVALLAEKCPERYSLELPTVLGE